MSSGPLFEGGLPRPDRHDGTLGGSPSERVEQSSQGTRAEHWGNAPLARASSPYSCLNCGTPLTDRFCAHCAQRARTERMDRHWLMHEAMHGIFHLDRGILFTLKELFTRPGHAVRDYLEGKRKRYFPPFTLVAILALAGVLFTKLIGLDVSAMMVGEQGLPSELRELQIAFMDSVMGNQSFFYLAMVPLMALFTWLWMRKYGHGFIEHIVVNTFIAAQVAALSFVTWPLARLGMNIQILSLLANGLYVIAMGWTFVQLYSVRPAWRVALRVLLALGSVLVTFFLTLAIATVVVVALGLVTIPGVEVQ